MIAHFILAGQSNMDQWFHAGDGAALTAFKDTFLALNPQYTDVQFFDAARGGSALLSGSASQYAAVRAPDDAALFDRIADNYWYDETTGEAGPNLSGFLDDIAVAVDAGVEFLGVIWAQGEADTTYVGANGADVYTQGLQFVLDELMQTSGAPQVYIQALGDRSFYSEELHGGTDAIRQAQQDIADTSDAITVTTTIFDLELRDSVHLTTEAYEQAAIRMAIAISSGETSPAIGEAILVDTNTILIQIELATDQQFSGAIALGGFTLFDDGTEIEILSAEISPSGLLRVETVTSVTNPTVSYAAVAQNVDMQTSDFIYVTGDNGTVPILPFSITLAQPSLQTTALANGIRVESGAESDIVVGLSGDDYLFGNDGNDILIGGWGRDRLYGGNGSDTFVLSDDSSTDIVYDFNVAEDAIGLYGVSLDSVSFRAYGANDLDIRTTNGQRIVLRNVDLEAADNIQFHTLGTEAANDLNGWSGDDIIFAGGGDDTVSGGAGDDWISLGAGADTVTFGTGFDTDIISDFDTTQDTILLVDIWASSLSVSQNTEGDLVLHTSSGDSLILQGVAPSEFDLINFEDSRPEVAFLTGTTGSDTLRGSAANDFINSFGGTDRLYGGGGNDVLVFGAGSGLNVVYDFEIGQDRVFIDAGNFEDLTILAYNTTDAEIRLDTGERLVLRNIDHNELNPDDFVFSMPVEFL